MDVRQKLDYREQQGIIEGILSIEESKSLGIISMDYQGG